MITQIKGNIINEALSGNYTHLAHGCNCFNRMQSGVAASISKTFPNAMLVDSKTNIGDISKLGNFTKVEYPTITIFNCYTQYRYGTDSRKLDYEALYCCFEKLNNILTNEDKLLIPKIGCGLAGGNWEIVYNMIDILLKDKQVVYVEYGN